MDSTPEAAPNQEQDQDRSPASVVTPPQATTQPIVGRSVAPDEVTPVLTGGGNDKSVSQQPVSDQAQQFKSGDQAAEIRPNRWDKWAAGWDQLSHEMPLGLPGADEPGAIGRWYIKQGIQEYSDQNGGPMLSAEQANKMYPGRSEPYSAPVSQMTADLEFNDRQRMQKISDWKNAGAATPWTDTAQSFFGGFADPLNLALTAAAGPIAGKLLPEAGSVAGRFATRYAENLGINATTGALTYGVEKSEGTNPSIGGSIKQAAEGALGGTLFGYATDALGSGLKSAWDSFKRESPDTQARVTKEVVASMDRNATPTLDAQRQVLDERHAGAIQDGQNVRRVTPPAETPTQFFAAADHAGNKAVFNEGLGPGTQLTSSADVANNKVSNPEGSTPGKIGETVIPKDAKLLDIDKPSGADFLENKEGTPSFLKALEEKTGLPIEDLAHSDQSIRDVIENLSQYAGHDGVPEDILTQAQEVAKEQGYTGYSFMRKAADGTAIDHMAHMFDENHPITGQEYVANPGVTPQISSIESEPGASAQQNPPGTVYSTPEVDKEVHDLKHGEVFNAKPDYMDPVVEDIFNQAHDELTKLAETSETAKQTLKELQRLSGDQKQQGNMAKMLADCVKGGMS